MPACKSIKNIETSENTIEFPEKTLSYTIFSPGDNPEVIENYLLLSIDGIGFLVIKHLIDLREL